MGLSVMIDAHKYERVHVGELRDCPCGAALLRPTASRQVRGKVTIAATVGATIIFLISPIPLVNFTGWGGLSRFGQEYQGTSAKQSEAEGRQNDFFLNHDFGVFEMIPSLKYGCWERASCATTRRKKKNASQSFWQQKTNVA